MSVKCEMDCGHVSVKCEMDCGHVSVKCEMDCGHVSVKCEMDCGQAWEPSATWELRLAPQPPSSLSTTACRTT